jgi:hypothetical protein
LVPGENGKALVTQEGTFVEDYTKIEIKQMSEGPGIK